MDELISKKALLQAITDIDDGYNMDIYTNEIREIIEELPTIPQTFKPIAEIKVDTDEIVERIKKDMESWKPTIIPQNNYNSAENNYNNAENGNIVDFEDKQTNTAEWKIVGKTTLHYECSKCGEAGDKWDKYCKHCGRKMTNAVAE